MTMYNHRGHNYVTNLIKIRPIMYFKKLKNCPPASFHRASQDRQVSEPAEETSH